MDCSGDSKDEKKGTKRKRCVSQQDLEACTLPLLHDLCTTLRVKGHTRRNKPQLIEMLLEHPKIHQQSEWIADCCESHAAHKKTKHGAAVEKAKITRAESKRIQELKDADFALWQAGKHEKCNTFHSLVPGALYAVTFELHKETKETGVRFFIITTHLTLIYRVKGDADKLELDLKVPFPTDDVELRHPDRVLRSAPIERQKLASASSNLTVDQIKALHTSHELWQLHPFIHQLCDDALEKLVNSREVIADDAALRAAIRPLHHYIHEVPLNESMLERLRPEAMALASDKMVLNVVRSPVDKAPRSTRYGSNPVKHFDVDDSYTHTSDSGMPGPPFYDDHLYLPGLRVLEPVVEYLVHEDALPELKKYLSRDVAGVVFAYCLAKAVICTMAKRNGAE